MKKLLVFSILFSLLFASCNKYPDGPKFSMLTKRSRMTGKWDLKETLHTNGSVLTNNDDYLITLKFNKDMSIETASGTYTGTWAFFTNNEQVRFDYNSLYKTYTIRRLAKDELWLLDLNTGDIYKYENTGK